MLDLKELILNEMEKIHLPNYYGSKEQIKNENLIYVESGIEMKYNESIEEYYYRVYHLQPNSKKELL
tara:strand:- start:504 stop:704 length:201 start_codon:yes stop_codon:yes gene_type:complete